MKTKEFDKLTQQIISPYLVVKEGFYFKKGVFAKEYDNGIRHLVMLDLDMRTGETFRVMVGFNSALISRETEPTAGGAYGVQYVSNQELSRNPKRFPCSDMSRATTSLRTLLIALETKVVPWLNLQVSILQVADLVEKEYPFVKGKLYWSIKQFDLARKYLEQHLVYLGTQPQTEDVIKGKRETESMLRQCP